MIYTDALEVLLNSCIVTATERGMWTYVAQWEESGPVRSLYRVRNALAYLRRLPLLPWSACRLPLHF